jgi:hypothetical protein
MTATKKVTKKAEASNEVDALASYRVKLNAEFDARIAYEKEQARDADILANKIAKLNSYRSNVAHDDVLKVMLASNVDLSFINATHKRNARCDIYRIERVTQLARALANVDSLHHYARAILACAKAFSDAQVEFSEDEVKSACSLDVQSKDKAREAICAKHKYAQHVAASTVQSQHASSAFALVAFNVLIKTQNAARRDVYKLNDCDATQKLIAKIS